MEKNEVKETPRKILFAQLIPSLKRSNASKVKSVLRPKFIFHYIPGAKRIDVISRVMFPGTFACLNIVYWAYYLTTAELASQETY